MANRWKIVLIATFFNLLFEYSMRGINNIRLNPFLPVILLFSYFILFTMVEDLIVRFRLKAYQLMILAFAYGAIYDAWISGVVFAPPVLFGLNWRNLILVGVIWWGAIQAVLTFYLANRLQLRDWDHPRMSFFGWLFCLISQFLIIGLFQASGKIPTGTLVGKRMIVFIFIACILILTITIRRRKDISTSFYASSFLDWLAGLTIVVFVCSAIFLANNASYYGSSLINAPAYTLVSRWTVGVALTLLFYRLISKKEISV